MQDNAGACMCPVVDDGPTIFANSKFWICCRHFDFSIAQTATTPNVNSCPVLCAFSIVMEGWPRKDGKLFQHGHGSQSNPNASNKFCKDMNTFHTVYCLSSQSNSYLVILFSFLRCVGQCIKHGDTWSTWMDVGGKYMVMINKIRNIASWFLMSTDKFQNQSFQSPSGFAVAKCLLKNCNSCYDITQPCWIWGVFFFFV